MAALMHCGKSHQLSELPSAAQRELNWIIISSSSIIIIHIYVHIIFVIVVVVLLLLRVCRCKHMYLVTIDPILTKKRASQFPNNNSVQNNVFTYWIFQRTQKMHLQAGTYYIAFCCFVFNNHLCIEGCISSQNFVDVHIHTDFSKKLSCTHGRVLWNLLFNFNLHFKLWE